MNKGGCKTGRTKESPNGGCKVGKKKAGQKKARTKYFISKVAPKSTAERRRGLKNYRTQNVDPARVEYIAERPGALVAPEDNIRYRSRNIYTTTAPMTQAEVDAQNEALFARERAQSAMVSNFLGDIEKKGRDLLDEPPGYVFNKNRIETDNAINSASIPYRVDRLATGLIPQQFLKIRNDDLDVGGHAVDRYAGHGHGQDGLLERYYAEEAEEFARNNEEESEPEEMQYQEVLRNAFGDEDELQDALVVKNRILQALIAHLESLDDDELVEERGMGGGEDPDLLYRNWNYMVGRAINNFGDVRLLGVHDIDDFIETLNTYSNVGRSSEGSGYWLPDDMGDIFADYWETAHDLMHQYSDTDFERNYIELPENLTDLISRLNPGESEYESD